MGKIKAMTAIYMTTSILSSGPIDEDNDDITGSDHFVFPRSEIRGVSFDGSNVSVQLVNMKQQDNVDINWMTYSQQRQLFEDLTCHDVDIDVHWMLMITKPQNSYPGIHHKWVREEKRPSRTD